MCARLLLKATLDRHKDDVIAYHCVTLRFNNLRLVKPAIVSPLTVVRRRAGVHIQQRESVGRRDLLRQGDRLQRRQTMYNVRQ